MEGLDRCRRCKGLVETRSGRHLFDEPCVPRPRIPFVHRVAVGDSEVLEDAAPTEAPVDPVAVAMAAARAAREAEILQVDGGGNPEAWGGLLGKITGR